MAETAAPAATPVSDAEPTPPPADAAPVATPEADAQPGAELSVETPPAATKRSVSELIDAGEVTLEDILANPKVQGHVGTLAERQAKAEREKADKEAAERRLDQAAEEDPDNPLAQERLRARQAAIIGNNATTWLNSSLTQWLDKQPKAVQDEYASTIQGKEYEGDFIAGMTAHFEDAVALAVKHDPGVKKLLEQAREAGRKEALGDANGSEPSADTGSGTPTGALTPERYQAMSFEERRKLQMEHPEQIDEMNKRFVAA